MSWMDSWSRPRKSQAIPAPYYETPGYENTPYCHSCGRVISTRKSTSSKTQATPPKYCSDRCRHSKPSALDRRIEEAFVALLTGADPSSIKPLHDPPHPPPAAEPKAAADGNVSATESIGSANGGKPRKHQQQQQQKKKTTKGDPRIIVLCSTVETAIFGDRADPEKVYGRKKNRAPRFVQDGEEWRSVDMESDNDDDEALSEDDHPPGGGVPLEGYADVKGNLGGGVKRPPQDKTLVNFSVGGERGWAEKIEETDEMLEKRREGQKRADEREKVRCAARRGCAFGFLVPTEADQGYNDGKGKLKNKKGGSIEKDGQGEERGTGEKEVRRKCEALMHDKAVEASFAKGEFGIRWRE